MVVNGVIVPTISFFNKDYKINKTLTSLLLKHVILNGADALFLFGTTGEGKHFVERYEQYSRMIKIAWEIAKDKVPILVGIYGNGVDEVIDQLTTLANDFEGISFVISPPSFQKLSIADLRSYFETIFGAIDFKNEIYLYNNPNIFHGNLIDPNIVKWLLSFSNLAGIKDSSEKINNYKAYLELLSDEFNVSCGKEGNFSTFMQLVPIEKRKLVGLVPSIGNITNIPSKLYKAALNDEMLELIQLQDKLNDIRTKIYDIAENTGKQQRGLKFSFKYLYENIINDEIKDCLRVCPEYERSLEAPVEDRIRATVNYMFNNQFINKYYAIGSELYDFNSLKQLLNEIDELDEFGELKRIKGPFEGKINSTYRLKIDYNDLVFRARISKAFRYEDIVKEKVLYPFLDHTLSSDMVNLQEEIKNILSTQKGHYIFKENNPPIVSVANLIYYDETKERFPYLYTLQDYIKGKPLYEVLEKAKISIELNTNKYIKLFKNLGQTLATIHEIHFDSFYDTIRDIGKPKKIEWPEQFNKQLENELQEARKNDVELIKDIRRFIKDNITLIEEENEPVLFHNDFHSHNIIVKENENNITIKGLIDFDNWQIGVRAQDFVKLEQWDLKHLNVELKDAFYQGYLKKSRQLIKNIKQKTEVYSLLWFLKVYNFEREKIRHSEQKAMVDKKFPTADSYLFEIKRILEK